MRWYNGFSPEQRMYGDKLVKEAIKDGRLQPLNQVSCVMCGQDKGVRHYHAEDYSPDKIIDDVVCLCWKCHMHVHSLDKSDPKWVQYEIDIKNGKRYKPTYTNYWTPDDDIDESKISLDEWL